MLIIIDVFFFQQKIRCIEAIPVGSTPIITYLDGIRDRQARQEILKERYFFTCECPLCEVEKEGPVILSGYDKLLSVQKYLNETIHSNGQLNLAKYVITIMEKIFCKYDERITNFYGVTLKKLILTLQGPYAFSVKVPVVKEFATRVEENLRITFGTGHKYYKHIMEEIFPQLEMTQNAKTLYQCNDCKH